MKSISCSESCPATTKALGLDSHVRIIDLEHGFDISGRLVYSLVDSVDSENHPIDDFVGNKSWLSPEVGLCPRG